MQRPILATQSDYGTADGRAAALSGNILKIAPEAIYSKLRRRLTYIPCSIFIPKGTRSTQAA